MGWQLDSQGTTVCWDWNFQAVPDQCTDMDHFPRKGVFAAAFPPPSPAGSKEHSKLGEGILLYRLCRKSHSQAHLTYTEPQGSPGKQKKPALTFRHLLNIPFLCPFTLYHHKLQKAPCFYLLRVLLFLLCAAKWNAKIKAGNSNYRGDTTAWSQFSHEASLVILISLWSESELCICLQQCHKTWKKTGVTLPIHFQTISC